MEKNKTKKSPLKTGELIILIGLTIFTLLEALAPLLFDSFVSFYREEITISFILLTCFVIYYIFKTRFKNKIMLILLIAIWLSYLASFIQISHYFWRFNPLSIETDTFVMPGIYHNVVEKVEQIEGSSILDDRYIVIPNLYVSLISLVIYIVRRLQRREAK